MKIYTITIIVMWIFIVMLAGCAGQPPVYVPYSEEVVDHAMGNGVHCYTWRIELHCLQISE